MINIKKAAGFIIGTSFALLMAVPAFAGTYTVAYSDSLYTIGNLFNTSSSVIMNSNRLSGSMIYPGQKLYVPCPTYTVKSGDSLYLIATSYNIPLDSLRKANNKWDNLLYPGQVLNIPASAGGSQTANTGTISRGTTSSATTSYSASNVDLLARLITAEAAGEPYNAQVAVGAVVVNRTKDSRFPSTIGGVIYQQSDGFYQFTPVENGWINKPATDDARRAAVEALNGNDPTYGAVYYFDDSATNQWLWSKPIAARIGHMVFTY